MRQVNYKHNHQEFIILLHSPIMIVYDIMFNTTLTCISAPTAVPTGIEAHQLNSTSVLLSWRPPLAQYQNGVIRSYYVEFTVVNSTEALFQYITQDQYLVINNLEPNTVYSYRVAAYTVGRGPFSESLTIFLNSETGMSKTNYYKIVTCHTWKSNQLELS